MAISYCLNTSTINGKKLDVSRQIEIATEAGYDSIELWIRDIERDLFEERASLKGICDFLKRSHIKVAGLISFIPWIQFTETADLFSKDNELARRIIEELECPYIAAPPEGGRRGPKINYQYVAERFQRFEEFLYPSGCKPLLEIWGFAENVSNIEDACQILCYKSGEKNLLLDLYHMYKGGSSNGDIASLQGINIPILHLNDYPDLPREMIKDKDRVYPGDGIAPISSALKEIRKIDTNSIYSLELFNHFYWLDNPLDVAKKGLRKMKQIVERAIGEI